MYLDPNEEYHYPACDDQPNGKDCICLDVIESKVDEEANNGENEFEGR